MELEMKKIDLDAYEATGELVLSQEETAETIVPDYCPDIARMIEANGTVFLHNRETRDGKMELSGTVKICVLYMPEGEIGIRTLDFNIPFHMESDSPSLSGCRHIIAHVEPESIEARMLNPRKVFTRCKLIARVTGYQKSTMIFSEEASAKKEFGIEMKQEMQRVTIVREICEKDFTFTDDLTLSPGREGVKELINNNFSWTVTEKKVVGNKLIFKGMFTFCVLYRTTGGKYCSTTGELPFSQIMEIECASENADVMLTLQSTGADIQISGDDPEGRQLAVTLYLHATAILREIQEVRMLTDIYSTAFEMDYSARPIALTEFCEKISRRQMVRELLEIGVIADTLLATAAHCGSVVVTREGDENVVLRSSVQARVLYLDEGGTPLLAERVIDVSCSLEVPEDCRLQAVAVCAEEVQGSLGERGIEVRFPVDFHIEVEKKVKKVCISEVSLNTEEPKDMPGMPSLILRCLGKQESAWDLAKRYNTTITTILTANELEEEPLPKDKLLLIPRKRG